MNLSNALTLFILLSLLVSTFYVSIVWIHKELRRRAGYIWVFSTFVALLVGVITFTPPTIFSANSQGTTSASSQAKSTPAVITTPQAATIPPTFTKSEITHIELNKSYPSNAVKDVTFTISIEVVSLPTSTLSSTPTPTDTPHAQPTPSVTPGATIQEMFGPGNNFFAAAQLSGSAFEIDPVQQAQQSFDQSSVTFTWTVIAKSPERQRLQAIVTGMWIPKSGAPSIERLLGRTTMTIFVQDTSFTAGQITLNDLFLFFVGSVLNVPWIWDLLTKSRAKRKLKQKTAPTLVVPPSVPLPLPQKRKRKK